MSATDPDPNVVQALLDTLPESFEARLDVLSKGWLGKPYLAFTLVGDADTPESFVWRLDGFDCVTYAETVIAMARAQDAADVATQLKRLRYRNAEVSWLARHHFMNRWMHHNLQAGNVQAVMPDRFVQTNEVRDLDLLVGYPVQSWPVTYLPVAALDDLATVARTGDIVGFISNKSNLDTFHVGLLTPTDKALLVRHAGRSAGEVVEEELSAFMTRNDVPGLLVARPLPA